MVLDIVRPQTAALWGLIGVCVSIMGSQSLTMKRGHHGFSVGIPALLTGGQHVETCLLRHRNAANLLELAH